MHDSMCCFHARTELKPVRFSLFLLDTGTRTGRARIILTGRRQWGTATSRRRTSGCGSTTTRCRAGRTSRRKRCGAEDDARRGVASTLGGSAIAQPAGCSASRSLCVSPVSTEPHALLPSTGVASLLLRNVVRGTAGGGRTPSGMRLRRPPRRTAACWRCRRGLRGTSPRSRRPCAGREAGRGGAGRCGSKRLPGPAGCKHASTFIQTDGLWRAAGRRAGARRLLPGAPHQGGGLRRCCLAMPRAAAARPARRAGAGARAMPPRRRPASSCCCGVLLLRPPCFLCFEYVVAACR